MRHESGKILALMLSLALFFGTVAPGLCAYATQTELPETTEEILFQETEPVEQTEPETTEETEPESTEQPEPDPTQETVVVETLPQKPETEVPAHSIPIPQFFQTDYPDVLYSHGTIADDGCGITCLAMVATYLTEHPYLPDELAGYFGGYLEGVVTNIERLEAASDLLQLPWRRATNVHDAMQAMREGKVVIAMMNQESLFTEMQHFIVLAGTTEDGKILVNDPYAPNYEKWNLKTGFQYGFRETELVAGFSGGWIYDKSAMPDEPFIYTEETVEVECRYPGLTLSREERELLARMVWVEARGETDKGQQAVVEVVLNRLWAEDYADNLRDILYSDNQFRSISHLDEAEPTQTQYEAVDAALNGPYILPIDVVHFATYPVNSQVWGTIGGHVFCYRWKET